MITEDLADGHGWLRICDASWDDPLDDTFAQERGGRWNPPGSWRTLYLNEDLVTARLNLDRFIADWPYEPEDLDVTHRTAPGRGTPATQRRRSRTSTRRPASRRPACPPSYPLDGGGAVVEHEPCQQVGQEVHDAGLRGVRCRSAQAPHGAGRELAWFPATGRSRARLVARLTFDEWFWG